MFLVICCLEGLLPSVSSSARYLTEPELMQHFPPQPCLKDALETTGGKEWREDDKQREGGTENMDDVNEKKVYVFF